MHITLDVSFHEMEPYYSGGDTQTSLQGKNGVEKSFENIENNFDESLKNDELSKAVIQGQNCSQDGEINYEGFCLH